MVTALQHETEAQMIYRKHKIEKKNIFTVAMETGLTERHVKKVLHAQGIKKRLIKDIPDAYFHEAMKRNKTTEQIKEEIGFSKPTINTRLRGLGYERVTQFHVRPRRDVLYRQYVTENKTREALAAFYNVSTAVVGRWIEYHGIQKLPIRSLLFSEKKELYMRFLRINLGRGKPSYKELYIFFVQRRWDRAELVAEYQVTPGVLRTWIKRYELKPGMPHLFEDTLGFAPECYIPPVTRKEFAKMVGIGYMTIQKYFAEVRKQLEEDGEMLYDECDYPKTDVPDPSA